MSHLRPVPEHAPPVLIDPPPSSEWQEGWAAAVAEYAPEIAEAYEHGLRARAVRPSYAALGYCAAFVAGFVVAVLSFA